MRRTLFIIISAAIFGLSASSRCAAFDTVKTSQGTFSGKVLEISSTKVRFQQIPSDVPAKEIPVNQIQLLTFDGEPADLRSAKLHIQGGRWNEALTALERIKDEPVRSEIKQDIEFYKALCVAKLALAGSKKVADGGRMMKAFVDAYPNSYHYYEAVEVLGDLLVAIGQYASAAEYYFRLQEAPWPEYKMRAGVAAGRALLEQNKAEAALAAFNKVLATTAEGPMAERQRLQAQLGKARALLALNNFQESAQLAEEVIQRAEAEDAQIMGPAYNILGSAQRRLGRTKQALLAFLHVDVLYSTAQAAHAEALANLVELWTETHRPERAERAKQTLLERYKDSPWAKKFQQAEDTPGE